MHIRYATMLKIKNASILCIVLQGVTNILINCNFDLGQNQNDLCTT